MKKRTGKTEQYWTQIIQEARDYAGGVKAYCADKKIGKNAYYNWFGRLRAKHPEWQDLNLVKNGLADRNGREPETEVVEKPQRRRFSAQYKAKILKETDDAPPGQVAAILRREGLYASSLREWRMARDEKALAPQKRGRKANPLTSENRKLKAQVERLEKQLHQANQIIGLQKKVAELLGTTLQELDEEE